MEEVTRRERLEQADERINRHIVEAARHWWGIGEVCIDVEREGWHLDGGYANVYAWAEQRHGLSRRSVMKAMEVARHFSASMAQRYGTEKLSATLRYLAVTHRVEQPGDVTALRFRVQRDGRFASIPFEEASYRDIDEARALVLASRGPARPDPDAGMQAKAKAISAALGSVPRGAVRGARVTVERDARGVQRFTFRGVSEAELEAFARAVLAQLG